MIMLIGWSLRRDWEIEFLFHHCSFAKRVQVLAFHDKENLFTHFTAVRIERG